MLIYWLLLAYPAVLALAYPVAGERLRASAAQGLGYAGFLLFYTLLAAFRFETGGDWLAYENIFDAIRYDTLGFAISFTDPLFGLVNWLSAQLGTGIYLVNGVCAGLLGLGVIAAARRLREPWLAITIAVPYLLIVVGLGYVRQGAAIGLILLAIAAFDQSRPVRTALTLLIAAGFHSTAVIVFPLFAYAIARRHKLLAVLFAALGVGVFLLVLAPRLDTFETGYIEAAYESGGALTRLLMSLLPSALLLLRWRHIGASDKVRSVWIGIALANFAALAALAVSPSSTAVDRLALFFSPAQMVAFGEFRDLVPLADRFAPLARVLLIGLAGLVQVIWLVFATHAEYWVPYQSLFEVGP